MLFPDEALFQYVLLDLADEVAANPPPAIDPLPCDRWIARSALQKACRRGEVAIAQRALANLFEYDRRAAWRAIVVIALEDVGVANVDVLARAVAAQRDRTWRQQVGGDWPVMAEIVRQIATSVHCQAACDLLLRSVNDASLEDRRTAGLDANPAITAATLWDGSAALLDRGIAALAMGGGLADGQRYHDACAVFDILAESSRSTHIVATCRAAWKLSRNEMALLLPLVWEEWIEGQHVVAADPMPAVDLINGVPGYALDQFTRTGNTISRALLRSDADLSDMFAAAGLPKTAHPRAVGDLLFLAEGGLVANRARWAVGDSLRMPHRCLRTVGQLGSHLPQMLRYIEDKGRQIALARRQTYLP